MPNRFLFLLTALLVIAGVARADDYRLRALMMIQNDFQAKGQAGLDRLETDSLQHVCNKYSDKPPEALLRLVEADGQVSGRRPPDG